MQPVVRTPAQIAADAFIDVIEANRIAIALGFGSAISASREVARTSAALYQATSLRDGLLPTSGIAEHVAAEIEIDRWRQYVAVHSAVAMEGALIVFNSVDLALKQYVRSRFGVNDRRWILGGPVYGRTPRSLFEIIRAVCNYFRHRDEWLVGSGLRQAARSIGVLTDLGINHNSSNAHLFVLGLLPFDTWLDLESVIIDAITNLQ